jgi:hypothetical protein
MSLSPVILDYVRDELLTEREAEHLTDVQRAVLEDPDIKSFIHTSFKTFRKVLILSDPTVYPLLETGALTVNLAMALPYHFINALRDPHFSQLVQDKLTISQLATMSGPVKQAFSSEQILQLIACDILKVEQALKLNETGISLLKFVTDRFPLEQIKEWIQTGKFSLEPIINLPTQNYVFENEIRHDADAILQWKDWIHSNLLTLDQALNLTLPAFNILRQANIQQLQQVGLSIAEILNLTEAAQQALCNEHVRQLIAAGRLTWEQAVHLTPSASYVLTHPSFFNELLNRGLSMVQILELTGAAEHALSKEHVWQWIDAGLLTLDQVLQLTPGASFALSHPHVLQFLTIEQILTIQGFTETCATALQDIDLYEWFTPELLSFDAFLTLPASAQLLLTDHRIRRWISSGLLTLNDLQQFTSENTYALNIPTVRRLIEDGELSVQQVLHLTPAAKKALSNNIIGQWVVQNFLNLDDILQLNEPAANALCSFYVQRLITSQMLPRNLVFTLSMDASNALCTLEVYQLLNEGIITIDQALSLTEAATKALCNQTVKDLIEDQTITIAEVLALNHFADELAHALKNPTVCQWLKDKTHNLESLADPSFLAASVKKAVSAKNLVDAAHMAAQGSRSPESRMNQLHPELLTSIVSFFGQNIDAKKEGRVQKYIEKCSTPKAF